MTRKDVYLTPEGLENVKAELEELVNVKRPDLAVRLREAIQMGDLKENADYIACKEEQGFLEGRIQELEEMIISAVIIEDVDPDVVSIGNTVTILESGEDDSEVYKIVGVTEANPSAGLISNESAIGKALVGAKKGQKVVAETPGGKIKFKILKIE